MAQGFPLMSLPPELRLQIYEHALPARIVPIFAMPVAWHDRPPHLQFHGYNGDHTGNLPWETYIEYIFTKPHPLPPLRSVNREMRRFHASKTKAAIESFKTPIPFDRRNMITRPYPNKSSPVSRFYERAVPRHQASRRYSFVEPKVDVYFLKDQLGSSLSRIDTLVRWLDHRSLANLKRLAISHRAWLAAVEGGYLCALREFRELEELWIVGFWVAFWPGGADGMVKWTKVKKMVVEELGKLGNGDKGWKVPRIRFADNEGSLEELVKR